MLYVFHVDTGMMLTFDMNLAMESVSRLQEVIAQTCRIAEDKQVLLISGGQSLSPNQRVCSYSAGTDTNPIFLFSKNTIESATPPAASISYGTEADLKEQVEDSMNMPPSYETIVTRSQLALKFHDVAKEQMAVCQKLVHDQHLQHQGWAAVIANLEDITSAFRNKWLSMSEKVEQHLKDRQHRIEVLGRFPETVQLLSKIPLLQCLLPSFALSMSATMAASTPSPTTPAQSVVSAASVSTASGQSPATLLEWITAQESRSTLDQMAKQCLDGLNQFDEKVRDGLREEVEGLLEAVNNPSMKEVKGLEDRLSGLEQLMYGAHKVVQEQGDMAQGFLANQTRARNLQDPSVLPDLCTSHKRQLVVMLKNHQSLLDIRSRCMRAKDELSENLHTRLRWVMYIEKTICDVHGKLVIYHQRLKKLQHCLRLILQMHNAPDVYCSAVLEVIRRKQFASSFIDWSSTLCGESKKLHEKELEKRHNFTSFFRNHFLQALFPGFSDRPPGFATKLPEKFDENLPPIETKDVNFLRQSVPELAEKLNVPDDINSSFVFPQLSVCDTLGRSSKDSFSQTTHSLESLGDQPSSIAEVPESLEASADVPPVDRGEQTKDGPKEDVGTDKESEHLGIQLLEQSGITVSQSVEVVMEADVTSMDEEDESLGAIKVGPHLGLSPSAEVPQETKPIHKQKGSSDGLLVSKVEKRDIKSASTNSPDSDEGASEGFTTADFYIDESMPSSLTESAGRKLAELQQVIQEKSSQIEHRDRELEDQKQQLEQTKLCLTKAQENFHLLNELIQKGTLQLRCDVLSVEKQVTKEKEEFASFMDSVTKKLVDMIGSFEESQVTKRDSEIERVKQESSVREAGLEAQLEVERGKLVNTHSELEVYERKLKEKTEECDILTQTHVKAVSELRDQHQEEISAVRNQMILEQEVELEKVKNDLELALKAKENELQELSDALDLKTKQLTSQKADMEKQEEILAEKFQQEKEELRRIIVAEFEEKEIDTRVTIKEEIKRNFEKEKEQILHDSEEKLRSLEETLKEQHDTTREKELSVMKQDLDNKHDEALQTLKSDLVQKHQVDLDKLRETFEAEHKQQVDNLTSEFETERKRLEEELSQLKRDHEQEIERLKHESLVETDTRETSPMLNLSVEDYVTISSHKEELQKVLVEQQQQKEQEISELVSKFEKEKHDSLQDMKTSTTAEKQVIFNEALSKVVADHQREMEAVRQIEQKLREQLHQATKGQEHTSLDDKAAQYPSLGSLESRPVPIQSELERELGQAKLRILQLEAQVSSAGGLHPAVAPVGLVGLLAPQPGPSTAPGGAMGVSVMGQSVAPVTDPAADPRIHTLEATIRTKTEEVNRLSHKIMELSMSTSFRGLVQDKVSITSCNPGDLVLLCLDDQRANYVVFTVTNLLHFLHSEYLDILGLKAGAGETKKSWVLAEVTDKEYCQAKKPQNRYNVPVGTKFYRIKAKPWSREYALQQQQQFRQQHLMGGLQPPGLTQSMAQQQQPPAAQSADPTATQSTTQSACDSKPTPSDS